MPIFPCFCTHEAQDHLHGKGMRVFNGLRRKPGYNPEYRCTVCGRVVTRPKPVGAYHTGGKNRTEEE